MFIPLATARGSVSGRLIYGTADSERVKGAFVGFADSCSKAISKRTPGYLRARSNLQCSFLVRSSVNHSQNRSVKREALSDHPRFTACFRVALHLFGQRAERVYRAS